MIWRWVDAYNEQKTLFRSIGFFISSFVWARINPTNFKPLFNFSASDGRATLLASDSDLMPRRKTIKRGPKRRTRKGTKTRGLRFVKGRVAFRVPGFTGVQKLAASQLVRFVPLSKLKTAAKRVLATSGRRPTNHRIRRKKRSSQGQRRKSKR